MVKLWGRGEEEKKERRQHAHEIVVAHTQGRASSSMGGIPNKQMIDSLGTAYFLQQDENVVDIVRQVWPELIPAISRLNATSKIEKPRDRRLLELYLEDILLHKEMELGDDDGVINVHGFGYVDLRMLIKTVRVFGVFRILDAMQGYRGKLVTEEIETSRHIIEEPKKKGIL